MISSSVQLENSTGQMLVPVVDITDQVIPGSSKLLSSGGCFQFQQEIIALIEGLFAI